MQVKIHYRNDEVRELYKASGVQTSQSAGFDLVLASEARFDQFGESKSLDLGVVIQVPKGCHSLLMPRSSSFKKFGFMQVNSVGLIDWDYSGAEDFWMLPVIYLKQEPIVIPAGTRICQFVLQQTLPIDEIVEFEPGQDSRGGFGSTGH